MAKYLTYFTAKPTRKGMEKSTEKQVVIAADAVDGSWVYRHAPLGFRPYLKLARLDRPVGAWLLLWPCWWSLALSLQGEPALVHLWYLVLFMVGAFVMRGAGCTYNDIVDRDFDGQVERTRSRPIPAGEVSVKKAFAFAGLQCLLGLLILIQFNGFAIFVGGASLALVAVYPFMKRITYWPQLWLGLTFNWGALMGSAVMLGEITAAAWVLYIGGIFWTLGYDTIYAHQDKEDDALVGVKSTALALGENTGKAIVVFYLLFVICLIYTGILANLSIIYYIGTALAATHLGVQVKRADINSPDACLEVFRSNIAFGWIVFAALVFGQVA